jgi:hypothetical protein
MKRVVIESPFAGQILMNQTYARFAMHDCLVNHNESPYASHLLYTQHHVLNDDIPEERKLGIEAGFCWRDVSEKTVFYNDLGMSSGMKLGVQDCESKGKSYEIRQLPESIWKRFLNVCEGMGWEAPERNGR